MEKNDAAYVKKWFIHAKEQLENVHFVCVDRKICWKIHHPSTIIFFPTKKSQTPFFSYIIFPTSVKNFKWQDHAKFAPEKLYHCQTHKLLYLKTKGQVLAKFHNITKHINCPNSKTKGPIQNIFMKK